MEENREFQIEELSRDIGTMDREQLKEELLRKVAHRKAALESYDQLSFIDSDNPLSEKESYRKLKSNLTDAKDLAYQDGYFDIISKRRGSADWRFSGRNPSESC